MPILVPRFQTHSRLLYLVALEQMLQAAFCLLACASQRQESVPARVEGTGRRCSLLLASPAASSREPAASLTLGSCSIFPQRQLCAAQGLSQRMHMRSQPPPTAGKTAPSRCRQLWLLVPTASQAKQHLSFRSQWLASSNFLTCPAWSLAFPLS